MTRPPTFRVQAPEAPADLTGDALRAWERAEIQRCTVELGRLIFEHDAAVDAQAERDATGAPLH